MSIQLHLTMKKGKMPLRGEDYLWSLMMEAHETGDIFSVRSIQLSSSVSEPTVREFVVRLLRGGFIEQKIERPMAWYAVAKPQAETPRVRKDGSIIESAGAAQCMWNAMRTAFRQGFDPIDLALFASTDDIQITLATVQGYIRSLSKAGYLIKLDKTLWRLDPSMNTGPKAPMILKTKLIFDPNKGDIIGAAEAEEVLA